jgi:uncharacterized repeat protein (TIGR01451 family)
MRTLRVIGALLIVIGTALSFGLNQPARAAANLQITASVSPSPMTIGDPATYTVTVSNSGSDDATDATTTITLDDNVTLGTLPDGCIASGQIVTCGGTGTTIAADATTTYRIPVTVKSSLSDGTNITLRASVSSSSAQTQTTQLISQAQTLTDVEITKTATPAAVEPGGTITYTITVTNKGPSDAVNVTVQDPTNGNLTTITSLPSQCPASGLTITCPLGTMTSGDSETFQFTSTVNSDVSDAAIINNCATVYTGTRESNTDNNVSCVDTEVGGTTPTDLYNVAITKTGPATVTAGETVTYTVTVTNAGDTDVPGLVFTDPDNSDLTVTGTNGACTPSNGVTRCLVGTETSGETKTYTVTETVDSSVGAGTQVDNCVSLTSTDVTVDESSCATSTVLAEASPSPSPSPSESASPTPSAPESPAGVLTPPAPSPPGSPIPSESSAPRRGRGALPTTGAPIAPSTGLGVGLVLTGLLLCLISRPRRRRQV